MAPALRPEQVMFLDNLSAHKGERVKESVEARGCGDGTGGENAGQDETPSSADRYVLPGEEVYPEGVAYDPQTGNFFVGSDMDGTVFRGNVGDDGEAEVFLVPGSDGREDATGMEVDERDQLFIAGRHGTDLRLRRDVWRVDPGVRHPPEPDDLHNRRGRYAPTGPPRVLRV